MRKFTDPFGISVLDLLSNALGATILLMLIVSMASRGTSDEENEGRLSEGDGKLITVLDRGEIKPVVDSLYTIELIIFGFKDTVRLDDKDTSNWQCYRTYTELSDLNDTWLIQQVKVFKEGETMTINLKKSIPDSTVVQATVFNGNVFVQCKTHTIKSKKMIVDRKHVNIFGYPY